MKTKLLTTLLVATASSVLLAQQPPPPDDNQQGGGQNSGQQQNQQGGGGQQGGQGHRPPPPPAVVRALDTDRNGVVSAEEIANASTSLLTLDKDGDGQLSRQELCPRPQLNNARNNRSSGQ
jgi:hypothetical protein